MPVQPTAMTGQLESSLLPRKILRDSLLYMLPVLVASAVLLVTGPRWAQLLAGVVDLLFALVSLFAVSAAFHLWRGYGRRHGLALMAYGGYLLLFGGLAVALFLA